MKRTGAVDTALNLGGVVGVADHLADSGGVARPVGDEGEVSPREGGEESAPVDLRSGVFRRVGTVVVPHTVAEAHAVALTRVVLVGRRLRSASVRGARQSREFRSEGLRIIPRPGFIGYALRVARNRFVTRLLFHKRKERDDAADVSRVSPVRFLLINVIVVEVGSRRGHDAVDVVIVVHGKHVLLDVVRALHTTRSFARRLHGGKQKTN